MAWAGWTVNFANPISVAVLAIVLIIIIGISFSPKKIVILYYTTIHYSTVINLIAVGRHYRYSSTFIPETLAFLLPKQPLFLHIFPIKL
jgi:hypothetical protein